MRCGTLRMTRALLNRQRCLLWLSCTLWRTPFVGTAARQACCPHFVPEEQSIARRAAAMMAYAWVYTMTDGYGLGCTSRVGKNLDGCFSCDDGSPCRTCPHMMLLPVAGRED